MKRIFHDYYEDEDFEIDIPDDLYRRAYCDADKDALFEVAMILKNDRSNGLSFPAILDIIYEAWDDGYGSEAAGEWLKECADDDGRFDAWS